MKTNFKRTLAWVLCLCSVLSLALPVAATEDTTTALEETPYVFPEYGEAYSLGEVLIGGMNLTEYALKVVKKGEQYLMASAKGGTLYVLKLGEFLRGENGGGTFIEAAVTHGINVPRGLVMDSKGISYTIGDSNYIFCYDFQNNNSTRINLPGADSRSITIDENDNLYVGVGKQIYKIELRNGNKMSFLFENSEITLPAAMHYGSNGDLYMWGNKTGQANAAVVYRLDPNTGAIKAKYTDTRADSGFYLSYIDGVLFGGDSASGSIAQVYDGETLQPLDLGVPAWIMGVVTNPTPEGKCYMQVNASGVFEYDVATRSLTRVGSLNAWNTNLRIRDPYIEVDYDGIKGMCIATMAAGHGLPSVLSVDGQGFRELDELVEETTSPAELRSIGPAVAGLKTVHSKADAMNATPQQASVYFGAYLSASVGAYYPDATEEEFRADSTVFSNGHAQTDSLLVYQNKIYAGVYNGGYIVEYDPATDEEVQVIPKGLKKDYEQIRIHGLAAGDNKLFFSTIPGDQIIGGAIGWIDLEKFHAGAPLEEYLFVHRNVVQDQAIISLVYDEEQNLLYGASSIYGGTNGKPTQDEAKMLVYDVDNKKVLGNFSVMSSENPHSDMNFDLTGIDKKPTYIAGISRDHNTGKLWGLVSRTLFTFEYNKSSNTLKIHEELAYGNNPKGEYPTGDSLQWFPRPLVFDNNGYLYVFMDFAGNMMRINASKPSEYVQISQSIASRKYTIGTDGNLYIAYGTELYRIALNRVDIVKGMIDGVEPRYQEKVEETRKAFEALTDEERAQFSQEYLDALAALEGAARIVRQVAAERAEKAINNIGALTASSVQSLVSARNAYEALDSVAKSMVTNYQALLDAEAAYAQICSKTKYGEPKKFELFLNNMGNPNMHGTLLQMVTYNNTYKSLWEYAFSTGNAASMKINGADHLQLNMIGGTINAPFLALRIKINEVGIYNITMESKKDSTVMGGIYIFQDEGLTGDNFEMPIRNEINLRTPYSTNFVGFMDFAKGGVQEIATWECKTAGEYIFVISALSGGGYARPMNVTFTKQIPTTDTLVEMAKERINAIGKVTKKSGDAIKEARYTYDALSAAQKELIYGEHIIKAAEEEYAYILANDTTDADNAAVALVELQINAIGKITVGSGYAIETAREAYDALEKRLQKKVSNYSKLTEAEAEYLLLTAEPVVEDPGSSSVIIIVVIALVVAAGVVAVLLISKKKKSAAKDNAPTVDEILDN